MSEGATGGAIHGGIAESATSTQDETARGGAAKAPGPGASASIPEEVARRYRISGHRLHFQDRTLAIEDRGTRLIAPTENPQVARDLVAIAVARGWQQITVTGSETFRERIRREAHAQDLTVQDGDERGLRGRAERASHTGDSNASSPSDIGHVVATQAAATQLSEAPSRKPRTGPGLQPGDVRVGELIASGAAPYHHDPTQSPSFFVRIGLPHGPKNFWGVDLERALQESPTRIQYGDEIALHYVAERPPRRRAKDGDGSPSRAPMRVWRIEPAEQYRQRVALAQSLRAPGADTSRIEQLQEPERSARLAIRAAEVLADWSLERREDRLRFTNAVRARLAHAIERNEPIPRVHLRPAGRAPATDIDAPARTLAAPDARTR